MGNYIFYTPQDLAELLIKRMPTKCGIESAVDICCGSWNLLQAVQKCYPTARVVGVDIDETSGEKRIKDAAFFNMDGRSFSKDRVLKNIKYDLILSNPPFGPLTVEEKLYQGDENILLQSKRYEAEMLWANYQLMHDQSTLLIILPSTYVEGSAYVKYRKWIAKQCVVHEVIYLPKDTFGKDNLRTVALILSKNNRKCTKSITKFCYASYLDEWRIFFSHTLEQDLIESGVWTQNATVHQNVERLNIFRGTISSKYFKEDGTDILHCSSIFSDSHWKPGLRRCNAIGVSSLKYASRGDIVINRIGRCAGYWCIYTGGKVLVSDCLIVIHAPTEEVVNIFEKMSTDCRLNIPLRGVSTQYITMEDISKLLSTHSTTIA